MGVPLRILIVEDSEDDAALLLRELRQGGFEPAATRVATATALTEALDRQEWDVVVADYSMPGFSGLAALELLRARNLDVPFIFVSGTIGEDTAVAAMRDGAHDYIMKGNLRRLPPAVARELREVQIRREHRQAETRIQRLAFYDILTDLPNRALLHDRLERAVLAGDRDGHALALLILDLDRFKEINDTLGHQTGDLVLQRVGRRIRSVLRAADTVSRLGGDEFAVLLSSTGEEHAGEVARRILAAVERPLDIQELDLHVGASIGVALFPRHAPDAETLMRRADAAMYAAKERRAGVMVYAPELDRHSPDRLALLGDLRSSIEREQLTLVYQPQVALETREVVGVEALARWRHPDFGMIPAARFIGLAEETGFIRTLTLWCLDAALRQAAVWHRAGLALSVAVNLSPRSLQDLHLPDRVDELLRRHNADAEWLDLEITENVIMADPVRARGILTALGRMGVRISIDDFGTGYSSLSYLKTLPVNRIKIDQSFVTQMALRHDEAIVRSTIDLAHNLGLAAVAEGVETREVWDRLRELGCDMAQGHYISEALAADRFARWLDVWRAGDLTSR